MVPGVERRKVAGMTIRDLALRAVVGVLTAMLIAVCSVSFAIYNDTASHNKDIAYLLKHIDQQDEAIARIQDEVRQIKDDMMESNAEFHRQAITKINELLARRVCKPSLLSRGRNGMPQSQAGQARTYRAQLN